ncbi:MAG: FAD-dependent oxidoreductase [Halofilum sp. (in: g-proteobacteria)]
MKPVVIIGTGLAGYTTARELRKHDAETPLVLVTADDGTSYSKPMLSNAFARGKTPESLAQATAEQMGEQLGAEIRIEQRAIALDPEARAVHLDDGETLQAHAIVLAVGARQADPGLAGDAADQVLAVNDLASYARVRAALSEARRVTLVGGGLIGCEFANDWGAAGYDVTMVEPREWPMGTMLPPMAGAHLRHALINSGVNVVCGRTATAVESGDEGLTVHDSAGDSYVADVAVRAIGLRPNTELAREAGLAIGGRGIQTNRALETSAPGIYALGDCAEVDGVLLPFILPINHCARALGASLAGERTEVDYPVMPVIAKTPSCPIHLYAPPAEVAGEWRETEADDGVRGEFLDADGDPRGFVLTGGAVQEKGAYAARVPGYFANRERG